jgi:hypothetical protein
MSCKAMIAVRGGIAIAHLICIKAKERGLADCVIQKLTNGRCTEDCPG